MSIVLLPVSQTEHQLIRPLFAQRAGELAVSQGKDFHVAGYDISKFFKIIIDGETFIIAAGNVIKQVLIDVLPKASQQYSSHFGTKNANKVLDALHLIDNWGERSDYQLFLSAEQFCFAFHIKADGTVDEKVLRLDLFRLIQQVGKTLEWVFTGGLFHALAHCSSKGYKLSTGNGEINLDEAIDILGVVVKGFFLRPHIHTSGQKYFETRTPLSTSRDLLCAFFKEPMIDAYFLATAHIKPALP